MWTRGIALGKISQADDRNTIGLLRRVFHKGFSFHHAVVAPQHELRCANEITLFQC
jgi:hypothetical protein